MIKLREVIIKANDIFLKWVANRTLNREKDPQKRFEVKLWLEMHGQTYDGESNYKKIFYDKLPTEDEQSRVRTTLLAMLKSDRYSLSKKAIIAYVCADIGVKDALQDINSLRQQAKGPSYEKQMLTLAYEALSRGITVHQLIEISEKSGPSLH